MEPALRDAGDASEHVSEPGLRIDVVQLRRRDAGFRERARQTGSGCSRGGVGDLSRSSNSTTRSTSLSVDEAPSHPRAKID